MKNVSLRSIVSLAFWLSGVSFGQAPKAALPDQVQRRWFNAYEQVFLEAQGDRLQIPGKERFLLAGTLQDQRGTSQLTITRELPGKLRVDTAGLSATALVFDGAQTSKTGGGPLTEEEKDLIETLYYDTADAFFSSRGRGGAYRFIGGGFRTDDGKSRNYKGPFYDVYELTTNLSARNEPSSKRWRFFLFNRATGFLEEVRSDLVRAGTKIKVRTVYTGWAKGPQSQAAPGKIQRFENGQLAWTFVLTGSAASPKLPDNSFSRP